MNKAILIAVAVVIVAAIGCGDGIDPDIRDFYEFTRTNTRSSADTIETTRAMGMLLAIVASTMAFCGGMYFAGRD